QDRIISYALAWTSLFALYFLLARLARVHHQWTGTHESMSLLWLPRWLSLRHSQDEGVGGLLMLPNVSFPIFAKDFAVAAITLTSVVMFPMLAVAAIFSTSLLHWLESHTGIGTFPSGNGIEIIFVPAATFIQALKIQIPFDFNFIG